MNKELEEAKNRLKILIHDDCTCEECEKNKEAYRTVLNYIENSISKEVIKEKIEYLNEMIRQNIEMKEYNQVDLQLCKKRILQELLEGKYYVINKQN